MKPERRKRSTEVKPFQLSDWGIDINDLTRCPKCSTHSLAVSADKKSWDCANCHWNWNVARQLGEKMIYDAAEIAPEIMRWHEHGAPLGASYGWPDLDPLLRARRGEWTIVTGWSSHGKSQFMDAVMVNMAINEKWKFGVFSPENVPYAQHIKGLLQKFSGKRFRADGHFASPVFKTSCMDRDEVLMGMEWLRRRFFFVDTPEPTFEQLLSQFWKLVKEKDIQGVIIDPWNELEHDIPWGMPETNYVGKVLIRFRDFCKAAHVHGWIVAHPSKSALESKGRKVNRDKPDDVERPLVGLLNISGSAHFENKPFNGVSVWRNPNGSEEEKHSNHIFVLKHRTEGVGGVGKIILTWDTLSTMYSSMSKTLMNGEFGMDKMKKAIDLKQGVVDAWRHFAKRLEPDWFLRDRPLIWKRVTDTKFDQEFTARTGDQVSYVWVDMDGIGRRRWWSSTEGAGVNVNQEHETVETAMDFSESEMMKPTQTERIEP